MENLIARYLDGELTEQEAASLLDSARRDPTLEAELRQYELMLGAAAKIERGVNPPGGFTDEVMDRVRAESTGRRIASVPRKYRWRIPLSLRPTIAAAAALVVFFASGYMTGRFHIGPAGRDGTGVSGEAPPAYTSSLTWMSSVPGDENLRILRLVYVPSHSRVSEVTIAGSFNQWDPSITPLRKEGNVWSAVLVLPVDSYEYMFVEDGERWVEDPLATQKRDDGFGGANAVLDLTM